ncbi:uncharacterized protein FIBRA_08760 [Fibroporia radiculosa]|uniref:DUF6534 domain-containing protein n=1 Tax=Fibroporia radiculosa TaxID=599839 RepID=J4ICI9_9APHY|nr:uncharacterized protein FIBRA_08760 [Fibroporia radiculosa]CCM06491.1 predicted protein [Fibroporia radiculosa]
MSAATPPSVEEQGGGFTLCIEIAIILYGIVTAQTYFYWWTSQEDSKLLRSLVVSVWCLETVHTVFCIYMNYHYTITDFGDLEDLLQINWGAGLFHLAKLDIEWRIYCTSLHTGNLALLTHRSVFTIAMLTTKLTYVASVFGTATASLMWKFHTWLDFRTSRAALITFTCGISLSGILDVLIALSQIYYLWINRTGHKATDNLVRTLMAYIINTGALTMCVSITIIATFWAPALKTSSLFGGLVAIQSKFYANSLIAMLNARQRHEAGRKQPSNLVEIELHESHGSSRSQNIEIFRDVREIIDYTLGKRSATGKD